MKKEITFLYIVDNELIIYKNNNIVTKTFANNILRYGKIVDNKKFFKDLKYILKKTNNNFFNNFNKLLFIINPSYTKTDIDVLKNDLEQFSGYKIVNENTCYPKVKNSIIMIINKTHLYLFLKNKYNYNLINFPYILFNNNINFLFKNLKSFVKKRKIIILGNHPNIFDLAQLFEKLNNNKCFIMEKPNTFIIQNIKDTI